MQDKTTHFAAQINQAQKRAMRQDPNMICMGLGINDPKNIFGTTQGLEDEFGSHRVFDMPTSENAMTGVGIGAAIAGTRVLMTHQRVDFFYLH
jgi:acetoin:2,6-dichlorophenolindophenol oxidoreductase subunit beta